MAVVAVAHRLCRNLFAMLRDGTVFDVGKLAIGTPTHGVMRVFGPTGLGRGCRPFEAALRWLRTIPGVGQRIAENLLAEIGPEMAVFPSAGHLASWGGMCPGNNESAGKRKSGKTPQGNRWLRRSLIEAAWAAARTKQTCLAAQYRRLAARRGKRGAVVAVGHTWSPPTTSFTRAAPMRTLARTTSTVSIPSG